jgi:ABC-type branched-subunit amino acid transport system ATPase component
MKVRSTSDVATTHVKICLYGQAGAGKTTALATLPDPIIVSAEAGLLSLRRHDLDFVEVKSLDDLREVFLWLRDSEQSKEYASVAIDSISEVAEVVLAAEKKANKDPRKAYGEMQEQMHDLVRAFRHRGILTAGDGSWLAKDRSGALDAWELPDLAHIIAKITG